MAGMWRLTSRGGFTPQVIFKSVSVFAQNAENKITRVKPLHFVPARIITIAP
jgi:hypothetical protein